MPPNFINDVNDVLKTISRDMATLLAEKFGGSVEQYYSFILSNGFGIDSGNIRNSLSKSLATGATSTKPKSTTTTKSVTKQGTGKTTAYGQFCKDVRTSVKAEIDSEYPDETGRERFKRVQITIADRWKSLSKKDLADYETIATHLNGDRIAVETARKGGDKSSPSPITPNTPTTVTKHCTVTLVGKHWTVKDTSLVVNNTSQKNVIGALSKKGSIVIELGPKHIEQIRKLGLRISAMAKIDPAACECLISK